MALVAGTRLGPYEILALLGARGMGEVYRARDPRLKCELALKVLPPEVASERCRARGGPLPRQDRRPGAVRAIYIKCANL